MTPAQFEDKLYQLTPIKTEVLRSFLNGAKDDEIARSLHRDPSTIRKHLSDASKIFFANQHNEPSSHCDGSIKHLAQSVTTTNDKIFSRRDDLIELFVRFKPKWVCDLYRRQFTPVAQSKPIQFETPGSPMSITSPFYIKRSRFEPYLDRIAQPGALIRFRAPRKWGKTSLLNRIRAGLREQDYHVVQFRFRDEVSLQTLQDLSKLVHWFCSRVNTSLDDSIESQKLPTQLEEMTPYFENSVLKQTELSIVLMLDDADCLFEYPDVAKQFFSLLRGWHEISKAPDKKIWQKLRMVIAHSTEDYIDFENSPFGNVSRATLLKALTPEQIQYLVNLYGLRGFGSTEIERLFNMTGGNPYFIQQALYDLKYEELRFDEMLKLAPTLQGIYQSHLIEIASRLKPHTELHNALKQVVESEGIRLNEIEAFKLQGLGVIQLQQNQAYWSCELYRRFFRDRF